MTGLRTALHWFALAGWLLLAGCADQSGTPAVAAREHVQRGAAALQKYGCGACHRIPGIASADGVVGPPLVDMARRVYIGRGLPNSRENMIRWLRAPQELAPRSAMPDMQMTPADAQAIVAYLYRPE